MFKKGIPSFTIIVVYSLFILIIFTFLIFFDFRVSSQYIKRETREHEIERTKKTFYDILNHEKLYTEYALDLLSSNMENLQKNIKLYEFLENIYNLYLSDTVDAVILEIGSESFVIRNNNFILQNYFLESREFEKIDETNLYLFSIDSEDSLYVAGKRKLLLSDSDGITIYALSLFNKSAAVKKSLANMIASENLYIIYNGKPIIFSQPDLKPIDCNNLLSDEVCIPLELKNLPEPLIIAKKFSFDHTDEFISFLFKRIFILVLVFAILILAILLIANYYLKKSLTHLISFTTSLIKDNKLIEYKPCMIKEMNDVAYELKIIFETLNNTQRGLNIAFKIFDSMREGVVITDSYNNVLYVNRAMSDITGYSKEEFIGKKPNIIKSDRHDKVFYEKMWNDILTKGHYTGEIWNRRKSGEVYPALISISAIRGENGEIERYIGVQYDITENKLYEEKLKESAFRDNLTGLSNRYLLNETVDHFIKKYRRENRCFGILFLDINNFKKINDAYGHLVGDCVLAEISKRLKENFRESDLIFRFGGDEFVVLVEDIKQKNSIFTIANKIRELVKIPLHLEDIELHLDCSIGISFFPDDSDNAQNLIKNADIAMYKAKEKGTGYIELFNSEMSIKGKKFLILESKIFNGLKNSEFFLNFQPKIDLKTKKILGTEALVRWVSDGKIIPPDEFIPVAEDAGFIDELGIFVLKEALKSIKIIQKEVPLKLNISINVSRLQMRNADFASRIKKEVTEYGVSFRDIILEITESALISSRETTSKIMNMLDEAGVKFSIDDFGTGITSISYIRDFPFNEIKIDKSFIKNIVGNKISQGIVKSIVALGSNLNIDVVAEGVEDEVTLKYLEDIGCDIAQGYFISKPLSLDDFIKFCNKNLMKFKVE